MASYFVYLRFHTSLAEDPYLGTSDEGVIPVCEDADGQPPAVQNKHSPTQFQVGEGKHTQVQRGGGRQDVAEEAREGVIHTVGQRTGAGTGGEVGKIREKESANFAVV